MKYSEENLGKLFGVNTRARHKNEGEGLDQYFISPIIHRQIQGDKIYVPLNLDRVWNRLS
ncbi:hypothetical protein P8864_09745 [Priestia flexa]|uniref:hypothetical protein n=1 Tax=Priestia flexa TaxID=86664 RepID=UPI000C24A861|nr:hypothetical protein [Priestia flexa]MEC0666180.1 hypothetical protein [Priestia flexa]MED3823743.1 hypothetical protein [Priestia flexa]